MAINAMKMSILKDAKEVGCINEDVFYPNGEKSYLVTWRIDNLSDTGKGSSSGEVRALVSRNFTIEYDDGVTLSWRLALVKSYLNSDLCYDFFPCFLPENHCKEAFVKIELNFNDEDYAKQCTASFGEIIKFDARDESTSVNLRYESSYGLSSCTAFCKIILSSLRKFSLSKDLGNVFENQNFTDVKLFSNDGKVFEAHKLILAARSSVFAAMFTYPMKENEQNEVKIADMDGELVEDMLRYIYTDKSEKLRPLSKDLLAVADKYDLMGLKYMCEDVLIENLSCSNAVEILLLSVSHNATRLKTEAIKFITTKENAEVFNTEAWKNLEPTIIVKEICEAFAKR